MHRKQQEELRYGAPEGSEDDLILEPLLDDLEWQRNPNSPHQPRKLSIWSLLLGLVFVLQLAFLLSHLTYPMIYKYIVGPSQVPPPPKPEAIKVIELPLPPVAPNNDLDSCSIEINPKRTGCIAQKSNLQSGSFLPDGKHVTASILFIGAPAAPDPASMYDGEQVILIKVDGTHFPNGDTWKCITCGVPAQNKVGHSPSFDYVQSFSDSKRLLAGANIIECDDALAGNCTPEATRIVPIFWSDSLDNEVGGKMREVRLHPDQEHLGWSSFVFNPPDFGQFGYIGKLGYNPSTARYEMTKVFLLVDAKDKSSIYVDGKELKTNPNAIMIGEVRGFSGSGEEITYIGAPVESGNADVFAINLVSGKVRRLTSHPEYVDPVDISPDDAWTVVMDTRGSNRQMFLSAMRGIPPLIDLVTFAAVCSVRNNGQRRFFQPYIIDRYGDRGNYFGQKLNSEGSGVAGSGDINDPEWNGAADPKWSPDGNRIVYTQKLTIAPACGGRNPLPCYPSTAEGGRVERLMLATLTSRKPYSPPPVTPFKDSVPWGVVHQPGARLPVRHSLPHGDFILHGKSSGAALVTLEDGRVEVSYDKFSDDGLNFINGKEKVLNEVKEVGGNLITWYSDINLTGEATGSKVTGSEGFQMSVNVFDNIFVANGTLITTIDGVSFHQPADRT